MIVSFPNPFPDELLYSLIARYAARVRAYSVQAFCRHLFGLNRVQTSIHCPTYIEHLAQSLDPRHGLTADRVILLLTLFPVYKPFLQQQADRLTQAMKTNAPSLMGQKLLGQRRTSITLPECLRYCPECFLDDRQDLGESYWHRLHQVPGVEVCPVHEVWLESSTVSARHLEGWHKLLTTEEVVQNIATRPISLHEPGRNALLQLARDAAWLLNQNSLPSDPFALWKRYRFLLREQGLSSYRGKVSTSQFLARFHNVFPTKFLARIEGTSGHLTSGRGILSLVRKPRGGLPPLYHLLMIQFFGKPAEEFFQMPAEPQDFGSGPWPCLNPVAPHCRELVVAKCSVHVQKDGGRPVATFSCGCGFQYVRVGPDWGPLARFSYTRVERYGPLWDRKFARLWSAPELTLPFISKAVGIAEKNLPLHAARLHLPVWRRENGRASQPGRKRTWRGRAGRPQAATFESMRQRWTFLYSKHTLSTDESREERRLYHWLYRHDHTWLSKQFTHGRKANRTPVKKQRVDWEERDKFLARIINDTASIPQHNMQSGLHSQNQLIRRSGFRHLIHPNLGRLPQTSEAIRRWLDLSRQS